MKKNKYICPEVKVYNMEVQNMLALSKVNGEADAKKPVLTNERDEKFVDIWGNEF